MQHGDELPLKVLESLFRQMDDAGIRTLQVSGGGEPLYHREIREIFSLLASSAFKIGTLTTNGILLAPPLTDVLLDKVRLQVTISLNCHTEPTYAALMQTPGKNFHRILDNIRGFMQEKKRRNQAGPKVVVQFLIQGDNFRDMPAMLELGRELGVDGVAFNPQVNLEEKREKFRENFAEVLGIAESLYRADDGGIIHNLNTLLPEINTEIQKLRDTKFAGKYPQVALREKNFNTLQTFCAMPWFSLHVKANGNVYPCCVLLNPEYIPAGNVHHDRLKAIWKGPQFAAMRKSMAEFVLCARTGSEDRMRAIPLPDICKIHGACFLRALPYLEDTGFCVAMDSIHRVKPFDNFDFPAVMKTGELAVLSGKLPGRFFALKGTTVRVLIDKVPSFSLQVKRSAFSIGFRPDPLPAGYHLLEVADAEGVVLAAQMVEKL
jgi:MoaA/NifB/PqqE/SkfB family radical SAM enzyme